MMNMIEQSDGAVCGACCTKLVDLGVSLGGRVILEHVNLHMHCGEMTALIGPNGAGKTTLLRVLLGELPHTGELQFIPFRADMRRPRVGYVPQKLEIDLLSPISVLDLFCGATSRWPVWLGHPRRTREATAATLAQVGADGLLFEKVGQLSGGQLQRVLLALALTPRPDVLLLDEPAAGVDTAGMRLFYEVISTLRHEHDLSVLLITHDLKGIAELAERMVFVAQRTILREGPPHEVLADARVRATMGFDVEAGRLPPPHKRRPLHGPAVTRRDGP